ncbi:MAG TPA: chemotaxis protein CheW [Bryobacterales bacterium]|nr:chemotaxis protein CheW [Bryobacterales bacterium]
MVNWAEVRARLERSGQALDEAVAHDPQRLEAVFRERAARLAKPHAFATGAPAGTWMFIFRLGMERYAIALHDLTEVISNPKCTPVPGSSPRLAGVINLKGEIRPVWDLARLLQLGGKQREQSGCVLLVRKKGREVGLWVDAAEQIRLLRPGQWQQPGERSPYLQGVTSDAVMILDTEVLLEKEFCR